MNFSTTFKWQARCHITFAYLGKIQWKNESFFYFAIGWPPLCPPDGWDEFFGISLVWTFRVFEANELVLVKREQTKCLHTHISTEIPLLFAFKRCFFHNFFLQLPFFAFNWFTFLLLLLLLVTTSTFFSLLVCQFRFFLHFIFIHTQSFEKFSVLQLSFLALKQTNKKKTNKKKTNAWKSYNFRNGQIFMHLKLDFTLSTEKAQEPDRERERGRSRQSNDRQATGNDNGNGNGLKSCRWNLIRENVENGNGNKAKRDAANRIKWIARL